MLGLVKFIYYLLWVIIILAIPAIIIGILAGTQKRKEREEELRLLKSIDDKLSKRDGK